MSELDSFSDEILRELDQSPVRSVNEVRSRIFSLTGILRSPTRIKAFLARYGLAHRKRRSGKGYSPLDFVDVDFRTSSRMKSIIPRSFSPN